jgi:peptidoglycan/xylan/chitin deacetylase (PgdA/CDA1 family)
MKCKEWLYRLFAFFVVRCTGVRLLATGRLFTEHNTGTVNDYSRQRTPSVEKRGYGFQILNYHNISAGRNDFLIDTVAVEEFEAQMRFVCSRYTIYPLGYLVDALLQGKIDQRAIAITFDDGYQDLYYFALPILKKMNIPATVFLVTGFVGTTQQLWFDRVLSVIEHCRCGELYLQTGDRLLSYPTETDADKVATAAEVLHVLKHMPPDLRDAVVEELEKTYNSKSVPVTQRRLLTWDQVKTMRKSGISFGAHTVHHNILTTLNHAQVEREIVDSRATIENVLQEPIDMFAYPNGKAADFDGTIKTVLKENKFKAAVSTIRGFNSASTDVFELHRGRPWMDDPDRFAFLLTWQRWKFALA